MAYTGFKNLVKSLSGKVSDPGAVAASIGRKKYGAKNFNKHAAAGKSMKGEPPLKK